MLVWLLKAVSLGWSVYKALVEPEKGYLLSLSLSIYPYPFPSPLTWVRLTENVETEKCFIRIAMEISQRWNVFKYLSASMKILLNL